MKWLFNTIETTDTQDVCYLLFLLLVLFNVGPVVAMICWLPHFLLTKPKEPGRWARGE